MFSSDSRVHCVQWDGSSSRNKGKKETKPAEGARCSHDGYKRGPKSPRQRQKQR